MVRTSPIEVLVTIPFSAQLIERLQEVSPQLKITVLPAHQTEDIPSVQWLKTEVLYTDMVLPDPSLAPNLRWVQLHYAGIEYAAQSSLSKKPEVVITSLSGALSSKVAEFILMMMLCLGMRMPDIFVNQTRREWPNDRNTRLLPLRELKDSTVGIIGYGSIGRELARLLYPFGVTILAAKRDAMNPRHNGYTPEGIGDPEGNCFHRLYPIQALSSMIKDCDFVINTLPLTPETRGLVNAEVLRVLKPTAFVIDISRGGIVDHHCLTSMLQENKLGGMALDIFATEPLPPDSPLWNMPNTIISPHIAGISQLYHERAITLFIENIKRYIAGLSLYNRYDVHKGY